MRPLPKLPISRSPLKTPKLVGAIASPQGAFGGAFFRPPDATRATSCPSVVNWSTYPAPAPATSSFFAASCLAYVTKMLPASAWIPNGAYPFGSFGSWNGSDTGANDLSKTSTRPLWKSVAYNLSAATASPLYTAPPAEESAPAIPAVPITAGDQPRTCPDPVATS